MMVGGITAPPKYPPPNPGNLQMWPERAKRLCSCDWVKDLKREIILPYQGDTRYNDKGPCKRESRKSREEGNVKMEAEIGVIHFEVEKEFTSLEI